jgi:hypothetical protein
MTYTRETETQARTPLCADATSHLPGPLNAVTRAREKGAFPMSETSPTSPAERFAAAKERFTAAALAVLRADPDAERQVREALLEIDAARTAGAVDADKERT